MSPLPSDPYIELCVPDAKTEQEFLRLAVQAAAMKYRKTHGSSINPPPQANYDEACSLQGSRDGDRRPAMAEARVLSLGLSTLHDAEHRDAGNKGTGATEVTPAESTISSVLEAVPIRKKYCRNRSAGQTDVS
jgi:hypothetical protein